MEPANASEPSPRRARIGMVLAPLSALAIFLSPLPLEPEAHRTAAIFAAVVVAWTTEVIPIAATSLLIPALLVAAGVTDARTAFRAFGDPLLFLFVGGFFIARAMSRHRLDRRIAGALLTAPGIRGRGARARGAFMIAAALLSMWISNTATTAILIPILLGALPNPKEDRDDDRPFHSSSVLSVAYAASVGGLGTLVGSPPNGITARFLSETGIEFGFVQWMMFGAPTGLLLTALVFVYLLRAGVPKGRSMPDLEPPTIEKTAMSRGEKITLASFGLAVVGWMVPGILAAADVPFGEALLAHLPGGAVALIAASILFIFRDGQNGERVLPWSDAARIDWGIIMLFAGGLALGHQMFETGLADAMATAFVELSGVSGVWALTAMVVFFTIFFTELCSNTATANMFLPLVIAVAQQLGVSPVPPALGVGMAASCAFMLPIATGPNAVAFGSGKITIPEMVKHGVGLNLLSGVLVFGMIRLLCAVYGYV